MQRAVAAEAVEATGGLIDKLRLGGGEKGTA
jgi:hypothetical protein